MIQSAAFQTGYLLYDTVDPWEWLSVLVSKGPLLAEFVERGEPLEDGPEVRLLRRFDSLLNIGILSPLGNGSTLNLLTISEVKAVPPLFFSRYSLIWPAIFPNLSSGSS